MGLLEHDLDFGTSSLWWNTSFGLDAVRKSLVRPQLVCHAMLTPMGELTLSEGWMQVERKWCEGMGVEEEGKLLLVCKISKKEKQNKSLGNCQIFY